jgi:hypothetical protein
MLAAPGRGTFPSRAPDIVSTMRSFGGVVLVNVACVPSGESEAPLAEVRSPCPERYGKTVQF